jgi:putative folate metabolism gamma-glutamate ligase
MKVTPVKTRIVEASSCRLDELLRESLSEIPERSVIAITSKVISLCEGNVVPLESGNKDEIIEGEAERFLPKSGNQYDVYLTIKYNLLVPSAGVDESNTNGHYVLWPKDPQQSANRCWRFLKDQFKLKQVGVIITDSVSAPLRWGVTGRCLAYCGLKGLNNKIGEADLFGRKLRMTRVNVADGLAAAAVLCMGESNEQTPLAVIEELPFVEFAAEPPADAELAGMTIDPGDDLYGQLLQAVEWRPKRNKENG